MIEYLIKWVDHSNQYNIWIPAAYIKADELIEEFKARRALIASLRHKTRRHTQQRSP